VLGCNPRPEFGYGKTLGTETLSLLTDFESEFAYGL
jgi:hypothetical protein